MMPIDAADEKGKRKRRRLVWIIVISAVLLLLAAGGLEAYRILYKPQDLFAIPTINPALLATQNTTSLPTPQPEETASAEVAGSTEMTTTPTVEPTIAPTPGITESKDVLNILLIGVDRRAMANGGVGKYAFERVGVGRAGKGKDPHSDVMMVLAINFKENKVDLISLPRDTFVHNPELVNGIYKLNAFFNVGGGFAAKDGAGFLKVCQAAEYMLGGIPVEYYYAVDFESLVKVVDAIGGVDFNVDSASYSHNNKKGMQHMDGEDVLYYMRSRKVGPEPGDLNRINRQKELLIAIFSQLKKNGKLTMVPDLISTANSGIFTNTNLEQTLAIVNYARTIDPKKIRMNSMVGASADSIYWRWCFTDQKKRRELIRQVYGIDVPEQVHCSQRYAGWLMSYGFDGLGYLKTAKQLLDYADTRKSNFSGDQQKAYDSLVASHTEMQKAWDLASLTFKSSDNRVMLNYERKLKADSIALAKLLDYKVKLRWTYDHRYWWNDPVINEVPVDFN